MSEEKEPLVSVIIPFFNSMPYLVEAIESVIQQEYKHWELIMIDDGATDGGTDIAKQYRDRFPEKIRYLEHEGHSNKGANISRDYGMSQASGQYIAMLDSDDIWLPGKLYSQIEIFRQHPEIAMTCEASLYWYNWQESTKKDEKINIGVSGNKVYQPPELALQLYPLGKGAAPCPSSLMFKKDLLSTVGPEPSFTGKYQFYEDQAFLIKVYLSKPVFVSAACNNLYRQRVGSVMDDAAKAGSYHMVRHYFLKWLQHYLKEQNINNRQIKNLLHKALFPYRFPRIHALLKRLSKH